MARKIDLMEFYAFIVRFEAEFHDTPGTAVLVMNFHVHAKTIKENLKKLAEMGKITYIDTGKYNTKYKLL